MYKIESNPAKNLLILHLEGFLSDEELAKGAAEVITKVNGLKPGFTVINDIAKMKPASQIGAAEIQKAMVHVTEKNVGRIIRVTSDPIAKLQFSRTSKNAGYIAEHVDTMEAALQMINA